MHDEAWIRAIETLPIIVWSAAVDGRIDYVSPRWTTATGLSAIAVTDDRWTSMLHSDDLVAARTAYERGIAAVMRFSFEARVRMSDESYRWMRVEFEPRRDPDGAVAGWIGVVLDIDEIDHAQQLFRMLGMAMPVIVWSADAEGWIDWYNGRWYDYTGQTPEEARGWGWQAVHHPDDFPELMRRWPLALQSGEPFEMEFRLRRNDGVFHWFLMRAEALRDETGKIVRWYGSGVDIDAQKNALERSKRIAETLQDVFLPSRLPQSEKLRIDGAYIAAERDALIGGDWYDAFELPDGSIVFSMGDVAGHGLDASVLVGRLRQTIYTLALKGGDPANILTDTNQVVSHQNPDTFVTAIVGTIHPERDRITFANAGHPPPFVASSESGTTQLRPASGPPLGVIGDYRYANESIAVGPDMLVLLYTDGMTEYARAIEPAEQKLRAAASLTVRDRTIAHPARAIQDLVLDGGTTQDDAAILVLHFSHFEEGLVASDPPIDRIWRFHSSDAHSAHVSRRQITAYLRQFAVEPAQLFTAELIAGELLANTVEHAPGLVEIEVSWQGGRVVMMVRDSGPGMNRIRYELPQNPLDEDGRGLFLVKRLALDFSARDLPGFGTEVRVTLPIETNIARRSARVLDSAH